jgi:N-acetylneuraminic acid mutarotase
MGWTAAARLPEPLAYGAAVSVREGVLLFGGQGPASLSKTILLFDGRSVRKAGELPEPTAMQGAALADGMIYLAGGQSTFEPTVARNHFWSCPVSDIIAGKAVWKTLPAWPGRPRFFPQVAASGGSVYVTGGSDLVPDPPVRLFLFDAYQYSPRTGWKNTMPLPRTSQAGLAAAVNGKLVVMGGSDGTLPEELRERHPGFRREVYVYDSKGDTWNKIGEMPASLVTTGITAWEGEFIIAGGEDRPGHRSPRVIAGRLQNER